MRLDKSQDLFWMKLNRSYNPTMSRANLGIGSSVKSLTKTCTKVYKLKIYDKAIDNLIHGNK